MRIFGQGFNFSQDGPGNRLVYHLSGCNMHCVWCSNPEGMCASAGSEYDVSEIIDACKRSSLLFFAGGGVTFTGGEATMQYEELLLALQGLKQENIHTALETNGTSAKLPQLLEHIDYLIMDFKHYDSKILKVYTGVGNETIKRNFEHQCAVGRQQHIRIPIINGINSDNPEGFASYFSAFNTQNTVFEFLPYHEYGKEKWKTKYEIENGFITEETQKHFHEAFAKHGLKIIRT